MIKDIKFYQIFIYSLGVIFSGSLVAIFMATVREYLPNTMSEVDFLTESATFSIVKDLRGQEPYMTFKMKCFYCDTEDYGESWRSIHYSKKCQDSIFDTCFRNRTVQGRHETHVLTFFRYCEIERCTCTDSAGWCYSQQCGSQNIRCCLDVRKESLLC